MAKQRPPVWAAHQSASNNAARRLPELAGRYFEAGRLLIRRRQPLTVLHQFRLETKRFRYTLELFRPCYGPGLDKRLAALRMIQDLLGDINDCVTTQNLLGRRYKTMDQALRRRISRKRSELNRYWQHTFDAAGREHWWSNYLKRFAKRK